MYELYFIVLLFLSYPMFSLALLAFELQVIKEGLLFLLSEHLFHLLKAFEGLLFLHEFLPELGFLLFELD